MIVSEIADIVQDLVLLKVRRPWCDEVFVAVLDYMKEGGCTDIKEYMDLDKLLKFEWHVTEPASRCRRAYHLITLDLSAWVINSPKDSRGSR